MSLQSWSPHAPAHWTGRVLRAESSAWELFLRAYFDSNIRRISLSLYVAQCVISTVLGKLGSTFMRVYWPECSSDVVQYDEVLLVAFHSSCTVS